MYSPFLQVLRDIFFIYLKLSPTPLPGQQRSRPRPSLKTCIRRCNRALQAPQAAPIAEPASLRALLKEPRVALQPVQIDRSNEVGIDIREALTLSASRQPGYSTQPTEPRIPQNNLPQALLTRPSEALPPPSKLLHIGLLPVASKPLVTLSSGTLDFYK